VKKDFMAKAAVFVKPYPADRPPFLAMALEIM